MIILLVPTSLSLLVYMCAQACTCVFDPSCTRISISCQVKVSPQAPLMCRAVPDVHKSDVAITEVLHLCVTSLEALEQLCLLPE